MDNAPNTEIPRLTKEQAAIIGAFTGIMMGPFSHVHEYAEKVSGEPIWTHQFANPSVWARLKDAAREDFLKIAHEGGQ